MSFGDERCKLQIERQLGHPIPSFTVRRLKIEFDYERGDQVALTFLIRDSLIPKIWSIVEGAFSVMSTTKKMKVTSQALFYKEVKAFSKVCERTDQFTLNLLISF